MIQESLNRRWYREGKPNAFLRMLEGFYQRGLESRRRKGLAERVTALESRPIVVVGNITAGGTGKTPLVIRLCKLLKNAGLKVGVISRGYGRQSKGTIDVTPDTSVIDCGDEPLLIARRTGCRMRVDEDRESAALALFKEGVDVVIADDGLQRWRLPRDIEICVVDAKRGFGNGHLLPAGPLREPISRLETVDYVVLNGKNDVKDAPEGAIRMVFEPTGFHGLESGETIEPPAMRAHVNARKVHAVAGIGNPERFFSLLESLGIELAGRHAFPDHHAYRQADFMSMGELILMTEKDAVKCEGLDLPEAWSLSIGARLPAEWETRLVERIARRVSEQSE